MTSSHDALYRAICAHPDEDTPRLAFADLVEEEGDGRRGEFIRTQIALSHAPIYDAVWVNARQHDPDAVTGWCMTHVLPKMPPGCSWQRFEFRRGFPWKVAVLSLATFLNSGAATFEAAPIQAIDLDQRDRPDLNSLAQWRELSRVQRLSLSTGWYGAREIARLTDSPHISKLAELSFEYESLAPDGLAALVASPFFQQIRVLELNTNAIPTALFVDSLGALRDAQSLSRLAMPYNRIGQNDATQLFALPLLRDIQELELNDNPLGAEGFRALADSHVIRGLRVLNLSSTRPGVPGIKSLTEASGLAGLRSLDLSNNALGPVAIDVIAACSGLRGLRVLNLANNHVRDSGACKLAASRALAGLLELDLREADIGNEGAIALTESQYLNNVLRLDIRTRNGRSLSRVAQTALRERFGNRVSF